MRFNEQVLYNDANNAVIKTFHSNVTPGKRIYNEHHHTECELSVFISGSGVYTVCGKEYTFQKGDMFLFGSNEAHCITEIYNELDLLNIHFEPRILWEHPENVELLNLFFARNKNFSNKLSHTDETLRNIILETEKEITDKKIAYKVQAKHILLSALVHILREYDYTKKDNTMIKNSSAVKKLKDAMLYIDRNLENKITLKEIADIACMTQTHFSAVFKKFNGISPWDYITIKRVEMAIEMLRTTDLTKLEIASRCGFSSHSNFYKMFARITGKTPSEYSRSISKKD